MNPEEKSINILSTREPVRILTGDKLRILEDGEESKRLIKSMLIKCVVGGAVEVLIEEYVSDGKGSFTHETVDENGETCLLTKKTLHAVTEDSKLNLNIRRGALRTDNASRKLNESWLD